MSLIKDNKNFIFRVVVICCAVILVVLVLGLLHSVKTYGNLKHDGDYLSKKHFKGTFGYPMKSLMLSKAKKLCLEQCGITDTLELSKTDESLTCLKTCISEQLGKK